MEIALGHYQVIGDTFSNTFYKLLYIVLCRNNALYCCHNALFFVIVLFICVYTEQNFLVWKANGSGCYRTTLWVFSGLAGWKLPLYPLRFLLRFLLLVVKYTALCFIAHCFCQNMFSFTLNSSTTVNVVHGFLSQFSTNFHEILHTLFSIHVAITLKRFDKYVSN